MIGVDTETALIEPGNLTPLLACMSISWDTTDPPPWLPAPGVDAIIVDRTELPSVCQHVKGAALVGLDHAVALAPDILAADTVWAFAPYDLGVLMAEGVDPHAVFAALDAGRVSDVLVRERLLALAFTGKVPPRVSLGGLAKQYLGLDMSADKQGPDSWRLRYGELDGIPVTEWPYEARRYALHDAAVTLEAHHRQLFAAPDRVDEYPLMEGPPGRRRVVTEARECRADFAFHLMAAWGVRTDPDAVGALQATWDAIIAQGVAAGTAGGWVRPPGKREGTKDTKALQAVISAAYKGDPPRTATCGAPVGGDGPCKRAKDHDGDCSLTGRAGGVKTDLETILWAADLVEAQDGDDVQSQRLVTYARSLKAAKASSVWSGPLHAGTTHPITSHPSHLVSTGRSAWSGPPWQQPPREGGVRDCVVPRPGFVFCSVDYEQAELVALSQIHLWLGLGDTMASAIRAGKDLHVVMATMIHQINTSCRVPYADAHAAVKAGDKYWSDKRQLSKAANFGFPGGLGAATFIEYARKTWGVVLDADPKAAAAKATALREVWHATWPEMRPYFNLVNAALDGRESHTIRQFVTGRIRGDVGYCDGCNSPFQGLIADVAKDASYRLQRAAYAEPGNAFYGSRPVLFLHDEVIAEVPADQAHEAAEEMARIMVQAAQDHIPDVPVRAEPALMDRWQKGAKTVRDDAGRLQVWAPRAERKAAA